MSTDDRIRADLRAGPVAGTPRPTVSVIVPCYQVADHLDECVASVVGQSFRDLEIVLVDDGSDDGTSELVDAWAERDERVRAVHHSANRGLGAARNTGIDNAVGHFLFFLDGDDVLPADSLERMMRAALSSGSDIVSGIAVRFDSTGASRAAQYRSPFDRDQVRTHIFKERLLVYDQMACSKLFRRSFWDAASLRFPEGVLYEDAALVMRAHCMAESVDLISTPTYRWRRRESGAPSITQDRFRPGSAAARFRAVAEADAYLRDHAPAAVWEEHGVKVMTVDVRLYSRLLVGAGDDFVDEFMTGGGRLVRAIAPSTVDRLTPAMREVRRALAAGEAPLVVRCTALFSGDARRRVLHSVCAALDLAVHHPFSAARIARGEVERLGSRLAARLPVRRPRAVSTPC